MTLEQPSVYVNQILFAFTRYSDEIAFVQDDRSYTYAHARDLIQRFVSVWRTTGMAGEGVSALALNRAEVYLAELALMLVGGRFSGLHPLGSRSDHAGICDDAQARALLIQPKFADHAGDVAARSAVVEQVFTVGPAAYGTDLLRLAADEKPAPLEPGPAGQDSFSRIFYTSGTTGVAKGCAHTQASIGQLQIACHRGWELPARPVYLATSPTTHAAFLMLMATLTAGGTVVLHESFDAERWIDAVARHRANLAFMVPTMIYAVLDSPNLTRTDLSSLETVVYGGSPMSPTRLGEALDMIGPVFTQIYGQTECLGNGTALWRRDHDPDRHPERMSSCGRALPHTRITLRDLDGGPVEVGQPGELCIWSPTIMKGYWRAPELTGQTIRDGWLHTGDVATVDDEGYYYIVDRMKDMIITGGFNVFPREVEDVLTGHPAVSGVAVIGVPHDKWGEEIKAVVMVRPGHSVEAAELIELVRERRGPHYAPKSVDFLDMLPLSGVGKVDKKALRASYWQGQERNVH